MQSNIPLKIPGSKLPQTYWMEEHTFILQTAVWAFLPRTWHVSSISSTGSSVRKVSAGQVWASPSVKGSLKFTMVPFMPMHARGEELSSQLSYHLGKE